MEGVSRRTRRFKMGGRRPADTAVIVHEANDNKKLLRRAQRFALDVPVRYREAGTAEWCEGRALNMSTSGVLFQATERLQPSAVLDIRLVLPVAIPGEAPAEIRSRGTVVRELVCADLEGTQTVAVAIGRNRFMRPVPESGDDGSPIENS